MKYIKGLIAAVVTVLTYIMAITQGNDHITANEWINVLICAFGAVSVFCATNLPAGVWAYTKQILAALTAGAVVLSSTITGGVTYTEWIQIIVAAAGAVGIFAFKNQGQVT